MQNKYKGGKYQIQLLKCITLGAEIDAINKIKKVKPQPGEYIWNAYSCQNVRTRAQGEESKSVRKKKKKPNIKMDSS